MDTMIRVAAVAGGSVPGVALVAAQLNAYSLANEARTNG